MRYFWRSLRPSFWRCIMNAKNLVSSLIALGLIGVSVAQAGPVIGTAKARGDYSSSFGQSRSYSTRARSSSRQYAPIVRTAPPAQYRAASPPVAVAQAPAEGRRYSYSPVPSATSAPASHAPCGGAAVPAPEANRRFSYQPSTTVESAPVRTYQPSHDYNGVNRSRNGNGREQWALPKTDPRKYSNR